MLNPKIENLIKNYKSNNSKATLIALITIVIFSFLVTIFFKAKYLMFLNLILLPIVVRIIIVYEFKNWKNIISKKFNIDSELIESISEENKITASKIFQSTKELIFFIFYTVIIIAISSYFFWQTTQLKYYGKETIAIVYQINSNLTNPSYALLEYNVKGKRYTTSIKLQFSDNFKYSERTYYGKNKIIAKVGQKFKVIYSIKNPEINEILKEEPIQ